MTPTGIARKPQIFESIEASMIKKCRRGTQCKETFSLAGLKGRILEYPDAVAFPLRIVQ
jgi:protein tyrosine phosphatase (PTP) superfamily phosphohydrolase (DUF442 family)